jgi:hypothetical protein
MPMTGNATFLGQYSSATLPPPCNNLIFTSQKSAQQFSRSRLWFYALM